MTEAVEAASVVIADGDANAREGMSAVLSGEADLEVVAEAGDCDEALEVCREIEPDLIVMDAGMPLMEDFAGARRIKAARPKTAVLILTADAGEDYLLEAIKGGAAGYVLEGRAEQDLLATVRSVLRGDSPLEQQLAARLLGRLLAAAEAGFGPPGEPAGSPASPLTPRELDVVRELAAGKTNRRIAQDLHLSPSTVKGHLERIMDKLDASDRTQVAVKAIELGLIGAARR